MKQATKVIAPLLLVVATLSHAEDGKHASVHLDARDIQWDDIGSPAASWSEEYKSRGCEAVALSEVIRLKTLVGHPDKGILDCFPSAEVGHFRGLS
jgi:hypothetical protein